MITVVVLQNDMVLRKGERGSSSDTCVTSTVDGNQATSIEGERVSSVTEEEDQLSTTIPEIKTEPTVSGVRCKDLLHLFMYCDFVLLAVHETETYFQRSQHSLLDRSAYSGLIQLMVCMV